MLKVEGLPEIYLFTVIIIIVVVNTELPCM